MSRMSDIRKQKQFNNEMCTEAEALLLWVEQRNLSEARACTVLAIAMYALMPDKPFARDLIHALAGLLNISDELRRPS